MDYSDSMEKIRLLAEIGVSLSAERDLDLLLEAIIENACHITQADGGTLYIVSEDKSQLEFSIIRNRTLGVRMGGKRDPIVWPAVPLYQPDGSENHAHVSAHVALTGDVINIPDVYEARGFNFEGTREFDKRTGYRSRSMLVVPMRNHERDIIGVLQLINAIDPQTDEVVPFDRVSQLLGEAIASQAAVALSKNQLINDLERLIHSFIVAIGEAIDEKSPYTGGHVRRVAELTQTLAEAVNEDTEGPFAEVHFTPDELEELKVAAWLHDVGKITTPEYIVDKATKLETLMDRIELIKLRLELRRVKGETEGREEKDNHGEELLDFLERINKGEEFVTDGMIERLKEIAQLSYDYQGASYPLLKADEVENLAVRRGTLTDREREVINNHARVTYKILSRLPFPKKLRRVPFFASAHHERLDGSGYPDGLTAKDLPIQARIIAFSDIFEALTARDRPYKRPITLEDSLRIMDDMAKKGHIDPQLLDLFVRKEIHKKYALKELSP